MPHTIDAPAITARETVEILATAYAIDPDGFGDIIATDDGPGMFEGEYVPAITAAIDAIGIAGLADETGGDVSADGHATRVGRFIVWCTSAGFRSLAVFPDADAASHAVALADDAAMGDDFDA